MTLSIHVSVTGQRLSIPSTRITSVSNLKSWIAEETGIAEVDQILMTADGKNAKQQHLVDGSHVFLYDKDILARDTLDTLKDDETIDLGELDEPPSTLGDKKSIGTWQDLFKRQRAWAQEVWTRAIAIGDDTTRIMNNCETIDRATSVAYRNLRNHVDSIMQTYDRTYRWASDCLTEHDTLLHEWRSDADKMENLLVRKDLVGLLNMTMPSLPGEIYMADLIGQNDRERDLHNVQEADRDFRERIAGLLQQSNNLRASTDDAASLTQVVWPDCETQADAQEIKALLSQISSDFDEVSSLPDDQRSLTRISRLVACHANDYIPAIQHALAACIDASRVYHDFEREIRLKSHQTLRKISSLQSNLASLHHALSTLSLPELGQTSLDNLDRALHTPSAYGSLLVEAVRRLEWQGNMRQSVDATQADVARYRQEELRARTKWAASIRPYLRMKSTNDQDTPAVNLTTSSQDWPVVKRMEILDYIGDLTRLGMSQAVEHVTSLFEALDGVQKVHSDRPRLYQHQDAHSIRPDIPEGQESEVKMLRDEKARLEERLRTSESRVRKLEDLVHRHEQSSRTTGGEFSPFQEVQGLNVSPLGSETHQLSQNTSLSRKSTSDQNDAKRMTQQILTLQAHVEQLRQVVDEERRSGTESRERMEEVEAVKIDLLANFETHRQEFEDERRRLEEDNQELKSRLEALEEELDLLTGSRDHERDKQEQALTQLRYELERLRKTSHEELDAMQTTKETLEHNLTVQTEKLTNVETLLNDERSASRSGRAESERSVLRWQEVQDQHKRYIATLQAAHNHLSPAGSPPDSLDRLTTALEVLAEGAAFHARGLDNTLQTMSERVRASEDLAANLDIEINEMRQRNEQLVEKLARKNQQTAEVSLQHDSLRVELLKKTEELSVLQHRVTTDTSRSEDLAAKLEGAESTLQRLTDGEAVSKVNNEALEARLVQRDTELHRSEERCATLRLTLDRRASKIRDMSERLFHNNKYIVRILENFGYSVSSQDDNTLLIQRASKANASTILSADASMSVRRMLSTSSAPTQYHTDKDDLASMDWLDLDDTTNEERKYASFLAALDRLDIDSTVDMITKRYKDVEALAKKYQKDSRALKERNHRLQNDARDKIAYRAFKEGDLALFLPTRNQVTRSWAAFNVGAPHYFLHEQDTHKLQSKEWLLARIHKIDERIVDLSRSSNTGRLGASTSADAGEAGSVRSVDDENPFELSDGLRWYLIDAVEEKAGAPSTPGLSKSTVAASVVDVQALMGSKSAAGRTPSNVVSAVNAAKTLHKSLDSRRSSEASRKSGIGPLRPSTSGSNVVAGMGSDGVMASQTSLVTQVKPSDSDESGGQTRADATVFEVARLVPSESVSALSKGASLQGLRDHTPLSNRPQPKPWDRLFSFQFQA